ncbi:MAG: ABC transporter permease [Methanosarcinales archaeon]|nr:ABC transporter permease [Methanosarcinales archaeon]
MKGFLKLVTTELKLFSRDPMPVFATLIRPIFILFFVMEFIIPAGNIPKDDVINEIVPSLMVLVVILVATFNIPMSAATYREIKFLKRLRATPVHSLAILNTLVSANFITCVLGIIPVILASVWIYQAEFEGCVLIFLFGFLLVFLSLTSFFLFIASTCENSRSAMAISIFILIPIMFFSGVFIPLDMLPNWIVNYISPLIPATYAVDLLQGLWVGDCISDFLIEVLILFGFLIIGFVVAIKLFKWE